MLYYQVCILKVLSRQQQCFSADACVAYLSSVYVSVILERLEVLFRGSLCTHISDTAVLFKGLATQQSYFEGLRVCGAPASRGRQRHCNKKNS